MTLTIELTPELEERLQHEAARQGVASELYARQLLEERLLPTQELPFWARASREEWVKAFNEWMDSHDPNLPPLPDEAYSRESFYGERG